MNIDKFDKKSNQVCLEVKPNKLPRAEAHGIPQAEKFVSRFHPRDKSHGISALNKDLKNKKTNSGNWIHYRTIERYEKPIGRTVEILIGLVTWIVITSPIWASYFIPDVIAIFILLMTFYWFWKSMTYGFSAALGFLRIYKDSKLDWLEMSLKQPEINKVRHVILIPNYKELQEKLEMTLDQIQKQTFNCKQIGIVLAMEEREAEKGQEKAEALILKYKDKFGGIIATFHPEIPGEVAGKSSNQAWAGKKAYQYFIKELSWDISFTTITSCDADSLFPKEYFSCLTYKFLTSEDRYSRFWQGHLTEYSNFQRVILPIKLMCSMNSVLRMGYSLQGDFFIPYSTYSSSFNLIHESGYWDVNVIPEDWHMYMKAFFYRKGDIKTEAINMTIHGDAIEGVNFIDALKNRYIQNRRHAWGVTDIPYFFKEFLKQPKEHFFKKLYFLLRIYEVHFLWPTSWFILTLGINIPNIINPSLKETVLGYNFSRISGSILGLSFFFTIFFIVLDRLARPHGNFGETKTEKILSILQWFMMPIISFFAAALPGLDAHTRLMLNKKIEYVVAPKGIEKSKRI